MNYLQELRSRQVTCVHCGTTGTLCHPNSDVRAFRYDGEHYYGSPIRQGSIVVTGNSCMPCVRAQAQKRQNSLSVMSSPLPARELRVNEMP